VSSLVEAVPAAEQKPSIPIIVKYTTTYYWQIVLAGARKAGRDLNVNVPQLDAQSESDINGQISIVQDPFRMGYEGIKTALAASKGEKVPDSVDTGANLITKENMNSERSKELLTPDVEK
jgi:ABC-type sugar transport system substrate-binding protein